MEKSKGMIETENRQGIEKIDEVADGIYHVIYPDDRKLGLAMIRFAEFYESPHFQGRNFTFQDYARWYLANSQGGQKKGKFTYYDDWPGFNLPSRTLEPFYNGEFDPLRRGELELLDSFRHKRGEKFYIIASSQEATPDLIRHEIAHGLFDMREGYQREVLRVLKEERRSGNPAPDRLRNYLLNMAGGVGYAADKLLDEEQAYLVAYDDILADGLDTPDMRKIHDRLMPIFDRFFITKE
ncbi:MAG: hypothetical protein Q8Q31_03835 [Nanoarchaeota archaeon]|nr:hypothetical protein [Nanoarchaeota archaeon]